MKHNNVDLSKEIAKTLNVKGSDQGTSYVEDVPIITIESNPKIVKDALVHSVTGATASGTTTILANTVYGNQNKLVRIRSVTLAYAKDATCDIASGGITIQITQNGLAKTLISLPVITLTAQSGSISQTYANGILLDDNTLVSLLGTFTAGVCVRSASITVTIEDK